MTTIGCAGNGAGASGGRVGAMADRVAIYALIDPRDGRERYIGKARDPQARLVRHLRDAYRRNTPLYAWVRKLQREGLTPRIVVLRWVSVAEWGKSESAEIARRRADLFLRDGLLNVADGGDKPECSIEQRSANAVKMNAVLKSDPLRAHARFLKAQLMTAYRKGEMPIKMQQRLRAAALRHPEFLGCFLAFDCDPLPA